MKKLTIISLALAHLITITAQAAPPANDNKASAAVLTGDTASVATMNVEATKEAGDFANRTLWWKWTAGGHGTLNLDCVNSTARYLAIAVYLLDGSGAVTGTVTISGSSFSTPPTRTFPVSSGSSYLICIGTTSSSDSGAVNLGLSLNRSSVIGSLPIAHSATMANDSFANRITLTGDIVTALGYTYSATKEPGEPTSAGNRTLWWQYRPSQNGRLTITSTNSLHDYPQIAVFMGTTINNLRAVRSHGSYSGASLTIPVTAGVDYKISYGSTSTSEVGTAIMNLSLNTTADVSSLPTPPATMENDSFAQRVTLTGDSVGAIAYSSSATTETGEPSYAGNRTFWWTYRPSGSGVLTITNQGTDINYSAISVYLGSTLSSLKGAILGEDFDDVLISFPVTGGVDYQIAFGTTSSSEAGSLVMSLTLDKSGPVGALDPLMTATMANDAFASRMQLTGRSVSALGYTLGAAKEAQEPAATGNRTLWYSWTANESGQTVLDFTGSYLNYEQLSTWTGSTLPTLSPASLYQLGGYLLGMDVTKGTTYHICLGHSRTDRAGYYVMTITGPEPVATAPVFTQQPLSKWASMNSTLTLTSTTDDAAATYQWQQDAKNITGATAATLTRSITALTQAGIYQVAATNITGTTPSEVAHIGVFSILTPAVSVAEGGKLTLAITAKAPSPISYRWRRAGSPLTDGKVGSTTTAGSGSATLSITGVTIANAGAYTCELRMADPVDVGEEIVGISGASSVSVLQKPVVEDLTVPEAAVSQAFTWQLAASQSPTSFIISGLPAGLTANIVTGLITGIPNAKGTAKIKVSAKNAAGTGPVKEFSLTIGELTPGLAGTYSGLVYRSPDLNASLGGSVTITVTAAGTFTGNMKQGTATHALKGRISVPVSGYPTAIINIVINKYPATLLLQFYPDSGFIDGSLEFSGGVGQLHARRNDWSRENLPTDFAGLYNATLKLPNLSNLDELPRGTGFMQMTVNGTTGAVAITGKTGDGTAFTSSSLLWPNGKVPLFSLLYSNKGSLLGMPEILASAIPDDSLILGDLDWQKNGPISASDRLYADGFQSLPLDIEGWKWVKPATGTMLFDLPNQPGNARIEFAHAGIEEVAQASDLPQTFQITPAHATKLATATSGNPCLVTVKIDAAKGLFSGTFKLTDIKPGTVSTKVTRSVSYSGILLKPLSEGYGVFQLPGLPSGSTAVPTLAGQVHLKQP